MRTISYKLDDLKKAVIRIGYVGENQHTQVRIDCKDLFKEYPDAAVSAAVVSPAGQSYPKVVTVDGSTVALDVTDSDLAAEGDGEIQLTFTEGGVVAKTAVARFNVYRSITAEGPAPDPVDDWLQEASEALEDIEAAEVNQPIIGQDGYWYTWDQEAGEYVKTSTKAQGEDGQPGHTPEKGVDYWTAADKAEMESDVAGAIIDDTSTALDKTWSASKSNTLLSEIQAKPDVKNSTKTGVDLDISDSQGNVILRVADGHIKTKKFDSETAGAEIIKNSTKTGVDLDVSDPQGNVILRMKDGNIDTKWFSSKNVDGAADYNADFAYSNTSGKKTISANFRQGDEIVLHLVDANDRIKDSVATKGVTYKYTDSSNTEHTIFQRNGYAYPTFTLPEDAVAVSAEYDSGMLWGESGTLRFSVYKKGITERKPHIIRVAADGSGDFTTIRDAVDSIDDNNAYNKYRIELYPGTYNVLADYTDNEISEEGFEGLFIGDGVSLVGIGQKDDIIIYGTIDTSEYNLSKRNDISAINLAGNARLENLTINAEFMRYCVHDDTGPLTQQAAVKKIINCVFNAANMTTGAIAYGCGISNMRKLHFKDCVFNQELHIHTANTGTYSPEVIIENCEGMIFSFADYNSVVDVEYTVLNSKFAFVKAEYSYAPHGQFLFVNQTGGMNPIVDCEDGMIYNLANCFKAKGQITSGQLVKVGRTDRSIVASAVTDPDISNGVSIGNINGETIIASKGYINSNQVGLTGLSVGDYITVDNDGTLVAGGTKSNAVGVVTGISDRQTGGAFIKLFI